MSYESRWSIVVLMLGEGASHCAHDSSVEHKMPFHVACIDGMYHAFCNKCGPLHSVLMWIYYMTLEPYVMTRESRDKGRVC